MKSFKLQETEIIQLGQVKNEHTKVTSHRSNSWASWELELKSETPSVRKSYTFYLFHLGHMLIL